MQIQKYRLSNGFNELEFPPGTFFTNRFEIQRDRQGGESLVTWVMVPTEDSERMEGEPLMVTYFVANTGDKFPVDDEVNGLEMFYEDTAMNSRGNIVKHIFSVQYRYADLDKEIAYEEKLADSGCGIPTIDENGMVIRIIDGKNPEEVRRALALSLSNLIRDEARREKAKFDMSEVRPVGNPIKGEPDEPETKPYSDIGDWFNSLQGMPSKKS